jgi:hypothetical protein
MGAGWKSCVTRNWVAAPSWTRVIELAPTGVNENASIDCTSCALPRTRFHPEQAHTLASPSALVGTNCNPVPPLARPASLLTPSVMSGLPITALPGCVWASAAPGPSNPADSPRATIHRLFRRIPELPPRVECCHVLSSYELPRWMNGRHPLRDGCGPSHDCYANVTPSVAEGTAATRIAVDSRVYPPC